MKVYVDSSVVLRRMLQQPGRIENWGSWDLAVTSELTQIEVRRSLDRLRLRGKLSDADIGAMMTLLREATAPFQELRIQPAILQRAASPFPTELGTLDAIHLATALGWQTDRGEPLTFLTHDRQLAIAAQASGLDVGPAVVTP